MKIIREVEEGCVLLVATSVGELQVQYEYADSSELTKPEYTDCGFGGVCYTVPFGDGWEVSVERVSELNMREFRDLVMVVQAFVTGKYRS